MAKAWTTLRGREVVALGRELLGGNGIVADFLVAKAFCDMEAYYTYEGARITHSVTWAVCMRHALCFASLHCMLQPCYACKHTSPRTSLVAHSSDNMMYLHANGWVCGTCG